MHQETDKKKRRSLISPEIQEARNTIRRLGWSQVELADRLGVTHLHLNYVLNGRRSSNRIIAEISKLPENPTPA